MSKKIKWCEYFFEHTEEVEHPHNGALIPAGWTVTDAYGNRVLWNEGGLEDAKWATLHHLEREEDSLKRRINRMLQGLG